MADNLLNRGQPDRRLINMNEDHFRTYWTKHLDVSREELQRAVDKVCNAAAAVRKELGKAASPGSPETRANRFVTILNHTA